MVLFRFSFFERERKGMKLDGYGNREALGGVGGGKEYDQFFCMKKFKLETTILF